MKNCKLLAPICHIVNYGNNQVKVEVAKFDADTSKLLQLVPGNDTKPYKPNEISLHLESTGKGSATNEAGTNENPSFNLRNVLDIDNVDGRRAFLGNLEPKSKDGRTLEFTFGAYYNLTEIPETEDWLTSTMSYHFSVVQTLPAVPAVPAVPPAPAP